MATVSELMDGLQARLETISGLRVFSQPADQVPVPAAIVGFPRTVNYDFVYKRGADRWSFTVILFVSRTEDRTAQERLGQFLNPTGATSVKTAIEADGTLGGKADSTRVTQATTGIFTVEGIDYFGSEFTVDVIS